MPHPLPTSPDPAAAFIARWGPSGGGELANYQIFLSELCDLLAVARPEPSGPDDRDNAYVFERHVHFDHGDGTGSTGRIDLYKRGCFVLEAKQGSAATDGAQPMLLAVAPAGRKKKGTAIRGSTAWDEAMERARGQAEQYVRALPASEHNPPFVVVVDVGHTIELYADFSRLGKTYTPFPDSQSHRLKLTDLAAEAVRARLAAVWTDPLSLDPARRSAKVTRQVAERLATLARSLEAAGHHAETVAHFLMRCIFTFFAEDARLIERQRPDEQPFTQLLRDLKGRPGQFVPMVEDVWKRMDAGGFSPALRRPLKRFNGKLFKESGALKLDAAQLDLLIDAGNSDWSDVEPAIFGTLLERALDDRERHKLGAHYTPRAYVERLVLPTVIEPLREQWDAAKAAAFTLNFQGEPEKARAAVRGFLAELCNTVVLDPACGTGNFLYVTMEHMKRLEGEARDLLRQLGETELLERGGLTVDPHQFLGLEINPRAVAIAELVLWIGYLKWHLRTLGHAPPEPLLKDFKNIKEQDAVLAYDEKKIVRDEQGKPVTRWDGRTMKVSPVTGEEVPDDAARVPVFEYVNPRKAEWPKADYVVGNPPFIGNKRMVSTLSEAYSATLRDVHADMPESADFVMYWWNQAAQLTSAGRIRRFGLITTNSITQAFNRRVVAAHLDTPGFRLAFVVPDHPWTEAEDGAAVRIAMSVGASGPDAGILAEVVREIPHDDGDIDVVLRASRGKINADLSLGANVAGAKALKANNGVCGQGMKLVGDFFVEDGFALGKPSPVTNLSTVRRMIAPGDVLEGTAPRWVIDFFELDSTDALRLNPAAYQRVVDRVKPLRDQNRRKSIKEIWWRFAWERPVIRAALKGLTRYFVTLETSKYRFFVSVEPSYLWDGSLFAIALEDFFVSGVLNSKVHSLWAVHSGGMLGPTPRYNRTASFEAFPFPDRDEHQKHRIRELGESLDAHRKRQQAAQPGLTITDMYNVLEKLRSGEALTAKDKKVHEQGLVSVLKQIHDDLDAAVAGAYGWPVDLPDAEILRRLVALNAERAEEERRGIIRWLRPEFQNPTGAKPTVQGELALPAKDAKGKAKPADKTAWPATLPEQARAVRAALAARAVPATPRELAKAFKGDRIDRVAELLATLASLGQARPTDDGRFAA